MITIYPDKAAWLASRREPGAYHIGASEIAAIVLGAGPIERRGDLPAWCDAYDLWLSHQPSYVAPAASGAASDGTAFEPLALRLYDAPEDMRLHVESLAVAAHPCGWLRATPDGWVTPDLDLSAANEQARSILLGNHSAGIGLVEIKTDRHRYASDVWTATEIREFSDGEPLGMPQHYWLQVQAQLACTGAAWCDVEAWLPRYSAMPERRRVRVYPSRRWPAIFAMVEAWRQRHLVDGEPPIAWTPEQIEDAQRRAYPSPTVERAATDRERELIADVVEAQAGTKRLDAVIKAARAELASCRGDAQKIFAPGIGSYTVTKTGVRIVGAKEQA